ncbi:MAG: MutS-related protein [Polyangiaceae bacterium]
MSAASSLYEKGKADCSRSLAALEARSRALAIARLATAGVALVLLGIVVWAHQGVWPAAALGASVVVFAALVFVHASAHSAIDRASAALRFHVRGLARLAHDWDHLPLTSTRFRTPEHPFANDLDLFGRASLMQLVDASETSFGEARLAALLSATGPGAWPDDVRARQAAVKDLAARTAFREALATAGGVVANDRPDPAGLLAWAESTDAPSEFLRWIGWAVPVALAGLLGLGPALDVPRSAITTAIVATLSLGVLVGQRLSPMLAKVSTRESAATRWRAMIALVEKETFEAPGLVALRERLVGGGRRASDELRALESIVGFVDARQNEMFRFLVGPLLMWDVHCTWALLRWRARSGARLRHWLETLGEIEALGSLGAFAFEHPEFAWPELAREPLFEGRALGHPLIVEARRVGNDVTLPSSGHALVVTGSNMSGKSTLLRAIGTNAVLGYAGAPACARAMRLGPMRVATAIRVEDSLEAGVSHFYAEIRRLKWVLDLAATPAPAPPVLFLLDEILHGTNSRERVIGACAVVKQLLARGALGAVSTHDLGITALEAELGGRVENTHFEEQITGDTMTFDYVLRPGIVKSSNALRLMRAIGIDVADR